MRLHRPRAFLPIIDTIVNVESHAGHVKSGRGSHHPLEFAEARELFFRYEGSRFYMSRDGSDRTYDSFAVPEAIEREWMAELTAQRIAGLSARGNWRSVNFLVSHRLPEHLGAVLAERPHGNLWERISYLELLVHLVRTTRAMPDEEMPEMVVDYVTTEARRLLRACRSDGSRERVEKVIASVTLDP